MGYTKIRESQSPQTGQFNSYIIIYDAINEEVYRLNPLKRVNSILTSEIVWVETIF